MARAAFVLPLHSGRSAQPEGCLVAGLSPRLPFDAEYRAFFERIAGQIAIALATARAVAVADAAVRIRDDFLSLAAHELKNPLTPLIGKLQLMQRRLQREGVGAEHIGAVGTAVAEAKRLVRLIDLLLDVSRLRSGQFTIDRVPFDLRAVVQHVAAEVQPTLTQHTLALTVPETPVMIAGDARRAIQAVAYFENRCFQIPTVLVACTDERVPKAFFGRGDLAVLLAPIPPHTIRWQEMLVGE
jgi:signal transduction histidine kinase